MKKNSTCSIVLTTNNMIVWYVKKDISATYRLSYDKNDGSSCRKDPNEEDDKYNKETPIEIGVDNSIGKS